MRNHLTRFLPVTAALVLVLSACGSDDPSSDPVDTPDTTQAVDGMRSPTPIEMTGSASSARAAGASTEVAASDMATDMMIAPWTVITEFVIGDLPALPDNTTGYVFDANGMPTTAEVAAVAAALGIDAEPEQIDDGYSVYWRVGPDDGTAPSMTLWDDAMQSWNYDWGWAAHESEMVACEMPGAEPVTTDVETVDPAAGAVAEESVVPPATIAPIEACPEPEPPVGLPSEADAQERSTELLSAMGVDPAGVTFETFADAWSTSVTANEQLDGVTIRSWSFSFGENAELQYAWGGNATAEPVGPYPLIDLDTAIARLEGDRFGGFGPVARGDVSLMDDAVSIAEPAPEPMPVDVPEAPPGEPIEPEEITVTLVDVQPDLWWVWDAEGSAWLVPAYRFIGDDGGWYTVPAVTDEFLVETEPTVEPTDPVEVTVPVDVTAPVDGAVPEDLGAAVGSDLESYTATAEAAGYEVRVVERNGEGLAVTDDFRLDRVNVAVAGDGGAEYVVRATLDDGTVLGESDIPGVTIVPIASASEHVDAYPACGNEPVRHDGVTWYPFDAGSAPELWKSAIESVNREVYEVAIVSGFARVAPPGPGDDLGTLIVWADGIARWMSDSGNLDVWLTTDELTYDWVC